MVPFILLAACVLAIAIVYAAYVIYCQKTYWKKRGMLSVDPTPIFGNVAPLFFRTVSFPNHMQNLYEKLPGARYYGMFNFKKPAIVLKDPDMIREVCVKSFDSFTDHDNFVTEEMDPFVGRNLFSLSGHRWKEVRNTLTPSFTAARMKVLFELIAECSDDFVQHFLEHPEYAKSFDAKDAFTRYTTDVIGTAAFGVKVNSMRDRDNDFFTLMRAAGATFLPRATDRFLKGLIHETVKVRRERGIVRQDMVHLMMQAMQKESGPKVTIDDIVGQAFFFFLAGFDTSSSLMCFMAHELAANPDIQERLRREIDEYYEKNNDEITYDTVSEMKYLDMVVSETLRKYPTAPFTNRLCVKEHELPPPMDGYPSYKIEKGTIVMISIYGLHRDPKHFPDPDRFDPERFSEENKNSINPYTYLPFGIGPRQCIGNRFALMEAKIVISSVLRKFVIKFTDKSKHPVSYDKINFSMTSQDGFWLSFEQRKKVN